MELSGCNSCIRGLNEKLLVIHRPLCFLSKWDARARFCWLLLVLDLKMRELRRVPTMRCVLAHKAVGRVHGCRVVLLIRCSIPMIWVRISLLCINPLSRTRHVEPSSSTSGTSSSTISWAHPHVDLAASSWVLKQGCVLLWSLVPSIDLVYRHIGLLVCVGFSGEQHGVWLPVHEIRSSCELYRKILNSILRQLDAQIVSPIVWLLNCSIAILKKCGRSSNLRLSFLHR